MNEQRGAAPLTLQNAKKRRIPAAVSSATKQLWGIKMSISNLPKWLIAKLGIECFGTKKTIGQGIVII